jgi:hypothetical protein
MAAVAAPAQPLHPIENLPSQGLISGNAAPPAKDAALQAKDAAAATMLQPRKKVKN